MAIANLHETLLSYKLRRSALNVEISELQAQKTLALYSQADKKALKAADEEEVRRYFKELYEEDSDVHAQYKNYTEIPEFEEEMDKIAAKWSDELAELSAWETQINAQITTDSAELEEVNAFIESIKSMLSTNIQDDFNYSLK